MTTPNEYLPGQTVFLTRRTTNRRFLLRPDNMTNRIVGYTTLLAAERAKVTLHVTMTMSNHTHTAMTDELGIRDEYMRYAHGEIAKKMNLVRGRRGHFFDASRPGNMELLDRGAQIDKILYSCLNPVQAGLVRRAEDWPGFKVLPKDWGKVLRIRRPRVYSKNMPEIATYPAMPPDWMVEEWGLEEARERICELLAKGEERIARERMKAGRCRIVGAVNVLKTSPFSTPKTKAPMRRRNPRFGAKSRELWEKAKEHYRKFLAYYREARAEWLDGNYDVAFPAGTVQLSRLAKIRCAPVDPERPGLPRPPNDRGA